MIESMLTESAGSILADEKFVLLVISLGVILFEVLRKSLRNEIQRSLHAMGI